MIQRIPAPGKVDQHVLKDFEDLKETVTAIRYIRKNQHIPDREKIKLRVKDANNNYKNIFEPVLQKLCNIENIEFTSQKIEGAMSFRVKTTEFYIPLQDRIDHSEELTRLKEELNYTRGFLQSVLTKLGNINFVKNAPEQIVKKERKKKEDAENMIRMLEERIADLGG